MGIFPTRRIVDEDENGNFINNDLVDVDIRDDSKLEGESDTIDGDPPILEYRDEKDRPWWKFLMNLNIESPMNLN